ncbi:PREDICTED: U4/U6.U5 tri-snRNP-associated protein 1-like, partial [Calidris pugnax]|uniref:U4/U6.U5 tri-snRNP-associated protein 1-like n=1 Tax=Calidris pugnax TaxID=198806 RepID=UPI00071D5295
MGLLWVSMGRCGVYGAPWGRYGSRGGRRGSPWVTVGRVSPPGLLETTVQKVPRVKAPNKSLPSAVYCIEDKMAIDDKYSRREEYRGFTQDFKEKDGYRPDVKIEYVDETGRKLTPKE